VGNRVRGQGIVVLFSRASRCYDAPPADDRRPALSETKDRPRPQDIRVIDRRMFTPDGVPRAGGPEEEPDPAPPARARDMSSPTAPATPRGAAPNARDQQQAAVQWRNLILNLATTAALNLGEEIPGHPLGQAAEIDLEGARQMIDLLQALQIKTRGNLNADESGLLESLLYDLRAKFLSVQTRAPKKS
jgi:hypothetical protein